VGGAKEGSRVGEGGKLISLNSDKIGFITDIHFTTRAPRWRKQTFAQELLDKIAYVKELCRVEGINTLMILGDLFHGKYVRIDEMMLIGSALQEIQAEIYLLLGNHDIYGGDPETYRDRAPGLFEKLSILKVMHDPITWGSHTFIPVPFSYKNHIEEREKCLQKVEGEKNIVLSHALILPQGAPTDEAVPVLRLDHPRVALQINGHVHYWEAMVDLGHTKLRPLGSIARLAAREENRERMPTMFVLSRKWTGTIYEPLDEELFHTTIPIEARPFAEAFSVDEARESKESKADFASFQATLASAMTTLEKQALDKLVIEDPKFAILGDRTKELLSNAVVAQMSH